MREARNKFTGQVVRVLVTPINGAHIVKADGSSVEMYRGSQVTAEAYVANLVNGQPEIWERVA